MEMRAVCVVAVLLTFFEVQCARIYNKHEYELQKINFKRVKEFPCGEPQRRVIPLSEIFGDQLATDQKVSPHVTVLYRCENAGCCPDPELTCSPATNEQVELGFMLTSIDGKSSLRVVKESNHTSCSCQPPDLPK